MQNSIYLGSHAKEQKHELTAAAGAWAKIWLLVPRRANFIHARIIRRKPLRWLRSLLTPLSTQPINVVCKSNTQRRLQAANNTGKCTPLISRARFTHSLWPLCRSGSDFRSHTRTLICAAISGRTCVCRRRTVIRIRSNTIRHWFCLSHPLSAGWNSAPSWFWAPWWVTSLL